MTLTIHVSCFTAHESCIGPYNGHRSCSLWGTNWSFIYQYNADAHSSYLPTSPRGVLGLISGHSMGDLWRTEYHWDRFVSQYFGFTLALSFYNYSKIIFILILPLSEGRAGEAWKSANKITFFWKSQGIWIEMYFYIVFNILISLQKKSFVYRWLRPQSANL